MMDVSGVRSSWLMVAMKSLLSSSRCGELLVLARELLVVLDVAHDERHLVAQGAHGGHARRRHDLVPTVEQADDAEQLVLGLERRREEAVEAFLLGRLEQAGHLRVGDGVVQPSPGLGEVDEAELLDPADERRVDAARATP